MNSNNNTAGGCGLIVVVLLVLSAFAGNIYLLYCLFGDFYLFKDDAGVITLMVLAVIADICLIGYLIYRKREKIKTEHEIEEKKAKEKAEKEIAVFLDSYQRVIETNNDNNEIPISKIESSFYNYEVITNFRLFMSEIKEINNKISILSSRILFIINREISDINAREEYLFSCKNTLDLYESEIRSLKNERSKRRIVLSEENDTTVCRVVNAFKKLRDSKKIEVLHGQPIDSLLTENIPKQLSYFKYKCKPLTLSIDSHIFCIFQNSILAFNEDGSFLTSLKPCDFRIEIERKQKSILAVDNTYQSNKIDSDSKCIQNGNTYSSWLHSRASGGPDLRYSYNPRYTYRTDIMEYGHVRISVANIYVEYNFSSSDAIQALETAKSLYEDADRKMENPIPYLISLFSIISPSDENVMNLKKAYSNIGEDKKAYCYIERD